MLSTAAKNAFLGSLSAVYVSAHDDYPGDDGANEISGGSPAYARQAITMAAAASGVRASSDSPVLDIPAGTLSWLGFWSAATSGTYYGCHPQGGARKRFFASASTDTITCPGHGYSDTNTVVIFGGGTAPGNITKGTIYFVRDSATDTFKLAETSGGSAIDLTSAGTGELWVSAITALTYGAQGTYTVTNATLDLTT